MKDEHKIHGWVGPHTPTYHKDWRDPYIDTLEALLQVGRIKEYSTEGILLIITDSDDSVLKFNSNMINEFERVIRGWCRAPKNPTPPDRLEEITDMLVKTYRDKKIHDFHVLQSGEVVWRSNSSIRTAFKLTDYDGIFNALEALYDEEFEIETQDDIKKVVEGAEVTLSNGVKLSAVRNCENGLFLWQPETGIEEWVMIIALKGAKVKQ